MTFRIATSPDGTLAIVNFGPSDLPETDAAVHAVLSSAVCKHNAEVLAGRRPTITFDFDRCEPVPPITRPLRLRHRISEHIASLNDYLLQLVDFAWRIYRLFSALIVTAVILHIFIFPLAEPSNQSADPQIVEPLFTPSGACSSESDDEFK